VVEDAGIIICLAQGADLHMVKLMPLPLSLAPVNPDWFYLSGTSSYCHNWILSRTIQVSWHQKGKSRHGKTNLDLLEQEIVSGSGIS